MGCTTLPAFFTPNVDTRTLFRVPALENRYPLWKVRRTLGDFLSFSAPQHVLLRFVVRGNLLDGLVAPYYFPRCHPLSPPRTPHVTPPTPVDPGTPPAARKQVSHRRFRLWSAPNPASAPRCSPLFVAPPQYTLNPRSAVGRDPGVRRCPDSRTCLCSVSSACFPHQRREHSACPKQTGQSFGQGALPPPHRKRVPTDISKKYACTSVLALFAVAQRSGPLFAAHTRSVSGVVAEFRYATLNANGNSAALRYTNRYG
ncbi:hypothetical protein PGTUg99_017272 [Puccinia graminis f. sp. tritici]|uniref:Uncharacterized protein n=1 Tax=Puccinia graminis f. sp. tritici TaxID=56615 RepID=A0A5B0LVG6_PUCGR|nr:hypothetical protein PGTUg99_017272 [Puccinia graminis f. sp. tritici]